jgi:2-polyprenyl-6-methoxyphenol hydroxylase-like FAD-dependent oxidoreductase
VEKTLMRNRQEERVLATLALDEAIREPWDVVVAGAGPAGALCAGILARRGMSVLLVDKSDFPRDKVCGSCLNGAALTALGIAGLGDLPAGLGAVRLHRMRIRAGGSEAIIPLPHGLALSRRAFDVALVRAAIDAGAAFLPRTEATLEPLSPGLRKIQLRAGGESVHSSTRVAVAADGLAGGFLKSITALAPIVAARAPMGIGAAIEDESDCYPPGTIYMGCTAGGYVGAVDQRPRQSRCFRKAVCHAQAVWPKRVFAARRTSPAAARMSRPRGSS